MDTPKVIAAKFNKNGVLLSVKKSGYTTPFLAGYPKYITVVFTGRGRIIHFYSSDSAGEASGRAIRAWLDTYSEWQCGGAKLPDPMWDRYVFNDGVYKRDR